MRRRGGHGRRGGRSLRHQLDQSGAGGVLDLSSAGFSLKGAETKVRPGSSSESGLHFRGPVEPASVLVSVVDMVKSALRAPRGPRQVNRAKLRSAL